MPKYYLHYVGKGLYTKEKFIAEAIRYGVSRAIPSNIIKNLDWGEPILLAFYDIIDETNNSIPSAIVFGYFYFTRLRHTGFTEEANQEFVKKLDVVEVVSSIANKIVRGCGSYVQGGITIVRDRPKDIIRKSEEIQEKYGIRVKWFLEGDFHKLSPEIVLNPINFTRSLMIVEIDRSISEIRSDVGVVVFSYDYHQQRYAQKHARGTLPIDYFF